MAESQSFFKEQWANLLFKFSPMKVSRAVSRICSFSLGEEIVREGHSGVETAALLWQVWEPRACGRNVFLSARSLPITDITALQTEEEELSRRERREKRKK